MCTFGVPLTADALMFRSQMKIVSSKKALFSRLIVLCGALTGAGLLFYVGRNLWFFGDEWNFLLHRSGFSFADLVRPHNEHWSAVPIVLYRIVFAGVSISSYIPYFMILVSLNLAIGFVVGNHLLKLGAPVLVAALVAGGLVTFGPGGENLLWSFQIGFTISVLTAILSFQQVEKERPANDARAAALLTVSLASSGIGVPAVGAVTLYLLLRRQWRRLLLAAGPPIAIYLMWLGLAGSAAAEGASTNLIEALFLVPAFTARGLTATLDGLSGLRIGLGFLAPILLGLAVASFLGSRPKKPVGVIALSMIMTLLVFAGVGLTRAVPLGIEQAASSRYVHIGAIFVVLGAGSAFFSSQAWESYRSKATAAALAFAAAAIVVSNLGVLQDFAWNRTALSDDVQASVTAMAAVLLSDGDGQYLDEASPVELNPDINVGALRRGLIDGTVRLPPGSVSSVPVVLVDQMRALMKTRIVAGGPGGPDAATIIRGVNEATLLGADHRCVSMEATGANPYLILEIVQPGWLAIEMFGEGVLEIFPLTESGFVASTSLDESVSAGETRWVEVADGLESVRINPPSGNAVVCSAFATGE